MQKQLPILFSTAMVQAILEGRKTMTRREMKPQPVKNLFEGNISGNSVDGWLMPGTQFFWPAGDTPDVSFLKCPYGKVGDVLYVREGWRVHSWYPDDGEICVTYLVGEHVQTCYDLPEEVFNRLWEQSCDDLAAAGYVIDADENYEDYDVKALRERPSIFMPKEAARIWLEVTNVRVEPLHDISQPDAENEGLQFDWSEGKQFKNYTNDHFELGDSRQSFETLWCKINGRKSWDAKPWVWVVSFKVLSTTGKPESLNI